MKVSVEFDASEADLEEILYKLEDYYASDEFEELQCISKEELIREYIMNIIDNDLYSEFWKKGIKIKSVGVLS